MTRIDPSIQVARLAASPAQGRRDRVASFDDALRGNLGRSPAEQARASAEELVAITLVEPTLALLRESNAAAPPFAPGDAEKAFGPMLDAEIARRVVRAKGFALVDRVASDLLKRSQPLRSAPSPGGAGHRIDADG